MPHHAIVHEIFSFYVSPVYEWYVFEQLFDHLNPFFVIGRRISAGDGWKADGDKNHNQQQENRQ